MSALPSLVRNSGLLLAGTAAAKALVLVATLVLGRRLGPEGFGLYSLVFAYLAFFELFADAGLDSLVVRDLARAPADAGRRLGDALLLRAILAAAAIPVAAALFGPITGRSEGGALLVLLGGAALLSSNRRPSLRSLLETPYRTALRMGLPTLLGILVEALHVALLVLWLPGGGVPAAVSAQLLASLPFLLVLGAFSRRALRVEVRPDRARLAALLGAASPLVAGLAVNVVLARADAVMLEVLRGTRDVGLYTAPVRIVEIANLLPVLLMTSVYPLFAASHPHDPVRVDRLFRGSLRVLGTVLVPVVAAQIVFAAPLVEVLFGASFGESARVLPILALSEVFVLADIVLTSRLVATGAERRNVSLVALAAATNVAANLWLIPESGPRGAAVATLIAYAVRVAAGLAFPDVRAPTRLAVGSLFPAVAAGLVSFGPAILFASLRPVSFVLGLAAYPVALYLLGGFRLRDLGALRSALRPDPGGRDVGRDRKRP
jgi:O-antigen/teichoic acid export membrane protein